MEQEQWKFVDLNAIQTGSLMSVFEAPQQQEQRVTLKGVPDGYFVLMGDSPWGGPGDALGFRGPKIEFVQYEDLYIDQDFPIDPDAAMNLDELAGIEATLKAFIALFESLTLTDEGQQELTNLRESLESIPDAREQLAKELEEVAKELEEEKEEARRPRCNGIFDEYKGEVIHSWSRCPIHGVV